jgi:hypothetical protein
MTVTLDELLMLVGRLDDSSGFDTPRERFRRFLVERAADARLVRSLVEQCQHSPGDQHHRALQDLVVVLGRCLGFDTRFASHTLPAGSSRPDGHWHARRLDVVLEIRTDQSRAADLDSLSRFASSAPAASPARTLGLCVLTPLYTNRGWLDAIPDSDDPGSLVRVMTLGSLLSLVDMVAARRLAHDDVVRLLGSGLELEFVARVLERAAGISHEPAPSVSPLSGVTADTSFWLAIVGADQGATPEQFAEIVIGRRRIFGLSEGGTSSGAPQPGDGVCFHIPGQGVVGHAQVLSVFEGGDGIRDAQRFSHVLHLDDVVLHLNAPAALDEELQLRVRAARAGPHSATRMSQKEYEGLATTRQVPERRGAARTEAVTPGAEADPEEPLSVGDSRSHG